jgi:hypothetical protein
MPRYYLHIVRDGEAIKDPEGYDLPDLDAAKREAISGAREILSEEVLRGSLSLDEHIEIVDDRGEVVFVIPFMSTVDIRCPHQVRNDSVEEPQAPSVSAARS